MRLRPVHLISIAVFCSVLLGISLWAIFFEYKRPWKHYQQEFARLESIISKTSAVKKRGAEIKQLWLGDLGITDRCMTCHQGIDRPKFSNVQQPYKTHSGDHLEIHKVEKYGCVICHDGQGEALTVRSAHGEEENWNKPLLKGHFTQSSCGQCHKLEQYLPLKIELESSPVLARGWKLFNEYNCIGCHKLTGYKRPERFSPALTNIGIKVTKEWLTGWLKDPRTYSPVTKMPGYRFSDEDINHIVSYLLSIKPLPVNPPSPPFVKRGGASENPLAKSGSLVSPTLKKGDIGGFSDSSLIKDGEQLVGKLGCIGCHKINEKGTAFGPDFSDIGNKVKPEWLYQFLKNPKSYDPKTIIPDFMISEEYIPAIVAYLMSLKKERDDQKVTENKGPFTGDTEKGKKLVKDLGCAGCHEIGKLPFRYSAPELDGIGEKRVDELVFNNINGIQKSLINWLKIKVADPGRFAAEKIITRMPNYHFNEEETEALSTFLLSLKKVRVPPAYMMKLIDPANPEMRGRRIFEKYNCLGCHKIGKEGGKIGPDLTGESKRVRPEWLYSFLKAPYKIRPLRILKASMPNFSMPEEDIIMIIEFLSLVSKEPFPYMHEPGQEVDIEDIQDGEKLYHEVFACIACHTVDGIGGEVGPDHTDMASRLNRKWIEKWINNPQAIQSETRMPRFTFKDWEFKALTDYLMTLRRYSFVKIKDVN